MSSGRAWRRRSSIPVEGLGRGVDEIRKLSDRSKRLTADASWQTEKIQMRVQKISRSNEGAETLGTRSNFPLIALGNRASGLALGVASDML